MDEKLQAVLAELKLAPGARVHSARWQYEPDGSVVARVLVDEGIGGIKVFQFPYREGAKALSLAEEEKPVAVEEMPEAPNPPPPFPEGKGQLEPEKRVATKRSKRK